MYNRKKSIFSQKHLSKHRNRTITALFILFHTVDQIIQTVKLLLAFMNLSQQFQSVGREETEQFLLLPFCPQFKIILHIPLTAAGIFQISEQELFFRQSVHRTSLLIP